MENKTIKILILLNVCLFIVIIGISCNFLAIVNNQGKMPVNAYLIEDERHFSYSNPSQIKYPSLADNFPVFNLMVSIGDFIMLLGVFAYFGLWGRFIVEGRKEKVN